MNKHLFRVIFNQSRGIRMVVQETACSDGKGRDGATHAGAPGCAFVLKPLVAALALLGCAAASAQIVPDRGAPGPQRPTVLKSANGTPTVNIQTPSAAGVSRNSYQQFDMDAKGAILNNSRTPVQSQIGGWIQGNAWLARGSARVIVNEINSAAASRLMGTMEVAGQRADVIVANPSGLVVDGLSFVNAAGVTLSTGRPLYGAGGSVDGFSVQGGLIQAQGLGLDATQADYAHILARAVSLNAGVWAQDLRVVTGVNEVAADGQPRGGGAEGRTKPQFALDVAQLGGMYAHRIFIVGTEAGLGVRNAGTLSATREALTLSADGQLHNTGAIASNGAAADLRIAAQGIGNHGTLTSQRDLELADGGSGTANSGTLLAQRALLARTGQLDNDPSGVVSAQRLDIDASGLRNAGRMTQTGAQALEVCAAALSSTGPDAVLGARPVSVQPVAPTDARVGLGHSAAERMPAESAPAPTTAQEGSSIDSMPSAALALASGRIAVAQHLDNTGALLANGATDLQTTQALTNSGTLQVRYLQSDGVLDNSQGTLRAQQLSGTHTALTNRAGAIHVENDLGLVAGHIDNTGGSIASAQSLTAQVEQTFANGAGTLLARGNVAISAHELQSNDQARIVSNAASVRLQTSGALSNRQSQIVTAGEDAEATIDIQAASLDNTQGDVRQNSAGMLRIAVDGTLRSDQARVVGNGSVEVTAASFSNAGGTLSALGALSVAAQQELSNVDGKLSAGQGTLLQAGGLIDNRRGSVSAAGKLHVTAGDIDNTQGSMTTPGVLRLRSTANVWNVQGTLRALGAVNLRAGQRLDNQSGILDSSQSRLHLQAWGIDNRHGRIGALQETSIRAQQLNNRAGAIAQRSTGQLRIDASERLDNAGGKILSQGDLALSAGDVSNQAGEILSQANARLEVGHIDSLQGLLQAGGALHLQSRADIGNHQGRMLAQGPLNVEATGQLINTEGEMQAAGAASLSSAGLNNHAGTISSTDALVVRTGVLTNDHGTLAAGRALQLSSTALENTSGEIGAVSIAIDTRQGALTNDEGRIIASEGDLSLQTGVLHSGKGLLQAARTLEIDTHGQVFINAGTTLALGNATIEAGEVNNAGGTFEAGNDASPATLTINAAGPLINDQGSVVASQALELHAGALQNNSGRMGAGSIHIDTREGTLRNDEGQIVASEGDLQLQTGALHSGRGRLQAAKDLEVNTHGQAFTNTGTALAQGHIAIDAGEVNNAGGSLQAGTDASAPGSTLRINAAEALINDQGSIIASQALELHSAALRNISGKR